MTSVAYQINDKKECNSISAWESIISLRRDNRLDRFYLWLNNDVYDDVQWHVPPLHSTAHYEEEHACRLRQQYDHIRVWYSGGSDSHSVVESFLRAGQPIDEIGSIFWKTVVSSETSGDGNQKLVMQMLTELYEKYNQPLPKISIVTIDKPHIVGHFTKGYFRKHVGYGGNFSYNLNQYAEIAKIAGEPSVKNYVEVFGLEKPRIVIDGNRAYFQMNDKHVMHAAANDTPIEWFYLPRLTPDLIRAQLWNIINYSKINHRVDTGDFIRRLQTQDTLYHTWCVLCGRTSSPKQNILAKQAKNVIGTSLDPAKWTRYTHIQQSSGDRDQSWHNYWEFANYEKELAKYWEITAETLPGILSKRYFLTEI